MRGPADGSVMAGTSLSAAVPSIAACLDAPAAAPPLDALLAAGDAQLLLTLLRQCEHERRQRPDAYSRIRACAYASALIRFGLQDDAQLAYGEPVPEDAWRDRFGRRFEAALECLWAADARGGLGRYLLSELAVVYRALQFDELGRLVRTSMRRSRGNAWLFRCSSLWEYPLRLDRRLLEQDSDTGLFPILEESTPVRLDLSHSGWSDIFFLAMEVPEQAQVINISVDLAIEAGDARQPKRAPRPPVSACVRVIDEPLIRLSSVDLQETVDCRSLEQIFDYSADHLGLLKAGLVASGLLPPAVDGTRQSLAHLLRVLVGPGRGLELCTRVDRIPKGSRLAVSTNLLASIISVCMRASGQIDRLEGGLSDDERRTVASRAILGEWLGGSGGGWQDSGGIWPGIKLITGQAAGPDDLEFGMSSGCLLPSHTPLSLTPAVLAALERSLVVFHGGMAGNVGPVLELVTSKHLVGWQHARQARAALQENFRGIILALQQGDLRQLGRLTQAAFQGPLREIIPGVANAYTDALIAAAQVTFGDGFWGFVMLGGMSGGGMAILVDPEIRDRVDREWPTILRQTADRFRQALRFVIEPVPCRIRINDAGTVARLHRKSQARMPAGYYLLHGPILARLRHEELAPLRREDFLNHLAQDESDTGDQRRLLQALVANFLPQAPRLAGEQSGDRLQELKRSHGFNAARQATLQQQLREGRISLLRNRLPEHSSIDDVPPESLLSPVETEAGRAALAAGEVAVVTLAGGVGSRWSGGGAVVKGLNPFVAFAGRWYNFLDLHLAKTQQLAGRLGVAVPQVITTSFLTDAPTRAYLQTAPSAGQSVLCSRGMLLNQRVVPTCRDLHAWLLEQPRPQLDEQAERARADRDRAWLHWAQAAGEASAYAANVPEQVLNPPGHWWELPSLIANGTLRELLAMQPQLRQLFVHNVDTLGAYPSAAELSAHLHSGAVVSFEMIERLSGDVGGSLALVDGKPRIVEGLAMPDESQELPLRWYNSNTCWVDIDGLLRLFDLRRGDLHDAERCRAAVLRLAARLPTYVTLKQVQRTWGQGQIDLFPVAQFEQLWADMSALGACRSAFIAADRRRGQQLKDVGQLPDWHLDGSAARIAALAGIETT